MDDIQTSMSIPLDDDGFLRRECPTCEREFKWFASDEGEADEVADEGYFCPYCGVQAPADSWWTKMQLELAQSVAYEQAMRPALEGFKKDIERSNMGGLVEARVDLSHPDSPPELTELNDMRRVEFSCHPDEPVKVAEDWTGQMYCLICGSPRAA